MRDISTVAKVPSATIFTDVNKNLVFKANAITKNSKLLVLYDIQDPSHENIPEIFAT